MKFSPFIVLFLFAHAAIAQPAWQQHVDTKIEVRLDDKHHFLHGFEELTYTNNSPDTLRFIYLHLWPNAYKNDETPFAKQMDVNRNTSFYYSKPKDKGYIDSLQFTINGHSVDHYSTEDAPDITRIDLPDPLLPGKSMKIATPFRVKIPIVFSRMGHSGQAYYISQWFPKPAVYDTKGWHPISYLDQGEFYSEYGSYDVAITLPQNYVVMATGNCTDERENKWMDSLAALPLPTRIYKFTKQQHDSIPASALETKTVHYHEDNIHDFAWFADKRWIVRKDTVYSPGNGQLVTAWAAFMPSYWHSWQKATGYLKETVKHYGKWVGPYQYKTIKAVLGDMHAGGGMEYPTVTIIDKSSQSQLQTVIVHEAGHNWFYGMLGSNERDHAWMDEGINTFYEQKTDRDLDQGVKKHRGISLSENILYYEFAATHNDQPTDQTSAGFTKINYGIDVYYKTALMLRWLEQYMGEQDFEAGMQDYYKTWHFHHPYPQDFIQCMQRHSGKTIDWFDPGVLTTDRKIDFTILHEKKTGDSTRVTMRNNTGVNAPVLIDALNHDGQTISRWSDPFSATASLSLPGTGWTKLRIDDVVPDAKTTNNEYRPGLFHRFGVSVKPFLGFNRSDKDKLFVFPIADYNQYDGISAGLLLHNVTLPENRFRFALAPLYAFHTRSLIGIGAVGYVWYPGGLFKEIMLEADGKTFHDDETYEGLSNRIYGGYSKFAPSLCFTFNEHDPLSPVTRTLLLKGYYINEQNILLSSDSLVPSRLYSRDLIYELVRYAHQNRRTYNPFSYALEGQLGADFAKIAAEGNIRVDYNKKNKALYVRGFLGKFFPISGDPAVYSRYELNSTYTGPDDYLYDGLYLGRNAQNGLGAQQVSIQEGGFKIPVYNNVDRSDNWMATINLETDLPRIPILRLFFDAGLIPNANPGYTHPGNTTVIYDGGLQVVIIKNLLSVYLPVVMSDDYRNYLTNAYGRKNVFGRSVSFSLKMQNIDLLKAPSALLRSVLR